MKTFVPLIVLAGVVSVMVSVSGHPLDGHAKPLKIALVKQPFIPNGTSVGPTTMADGGIQAELKKLGAEVRISEIALTKQQEPEYGGWKRLSYAPGHLGRTVAGNYSDGFFNIGLLGTCPSMPGMVHVAGGDEATRSTQQDHRPDLCARGHGCTRST